MSVKVKVYKKTTNELPEYKTSGSAGLDVRSNENITLEPNQTMCIKTGLFVAIPEGYEIQVRPRSGLSLTTKLRVSNSPGTIDSDYRDEIGVILDNIGNTPITFFKGERIAQFVLKKVEQLEWEEVTSKTELGDEDRGGGFGSTGIK